MIDALGQDGYLPDDQLFTSLREGYLKIMKFFECALKSLIVSSLSLVLLTVAGCGGNRGDIGAAGTIPADIPEDSDAAIAEADALAEQELQNPARHVLD